MQKRTSILVGSGVSIVIGILLIIGGVALISVSERYLKGIIPPEYGGGQQIPLFGDRNPYQDMGTLLAIIGIILFLAGLAGTIWWKKAQKR